MGHERKTERKGEADETPAPTDKKALPLTRREFTDGPPQPTPPPGFWDFRALTANVPLGERTLREYIKRKILPCIRVSGGRRILFHPESVTKALLRYQQGGITE